MKAKAPTPNAGHQSSRRTVLGALAATTALAGCSSPKPCPTPSHDGYGAPLPATDAGKANRALFVLWLLLTTRLEYFPMGALDDDNKSTMAPAQKLVISDVLKDLKYFYDGKPADQNAAIVEILTYIGNNSYTDGRALANGKVIPVEINYGTALVAVRNLFQSITYLNPGQDLQAKDGAQFLYQGGKPGCPNDINELLSIATDSPVTKDPTA